RCGPPSGARRGGAMPATIALNVSGVTIPAQKSSQSPASTSGVASPVARARSCANEAPRSCKCRNTFLIRASISGGAALPSRRSPAAPRPPARPGPRAPPGARNPPPPPPAGDPQPAEPLALVALEARGQEVLLPDARGQVLALQELERREHAGRPDQAMVGMQ